MTVTLRTNSGSNGMLMSPLIAFMPRMDWPSCRICTRLPLRLRMTGAPALGPKALFCTPETCSSRPPSVRFCACGLSTVTRLSMREGWLASTCRVGRVGASAARAEWRATD